MNHHLTKDAVALAANAKTDPTALADILATLDATELRRLVGRLALMVNWAADHEDREAFWTEMAHLARCGA